MAKIAGQRVSVIATPQDVNPGDATRHYTFQNDDGANAVYLRSRAGHGYPATSTFLGTAAQLRAMGANELLAGEALILDPPVSAIEIVCATGQTATVRVLCGRYVA